MRPGLLLPRGSREPRVCNGLTPPGLTRTTPSEILSHFIRTGRLVLTASADDEASESAPHGRGLFTAAAGSAAASRRSAPRRSVTLHPLPLMASTRGVGRMVRPHRDIVAHGPHPKPVHRCRMQEHGGRATTHSQQLFRCWIQADTTSGYGVQIIRSCMPLFMVTVFGAGPVTSKWILPVDCAPCGIDAPLMLIGLATSHSTR